MSFCAEKLPHPLRARIDPVPPSGCWVWTGPLNNSGYGSVYYNGHVWLVHRLSHDVLVGPIPPGLTVDHLCKVRTCVNTDHMELVDLRTNILRGSSLQARYAARTECGKCGGPLEYIDRFRTHSCRPCGNARILAYAKKYRAKHDVKIKAYLKAWREARRAAKNSPAPAKSAGAER